jgi:hypothetical protein
MTETIRGFLLLVSLSALAFAGEVHADSVDEVLATPLKPDEGILVLRVDTEFAFKSLRLKRPSQPIGDLFAEDAPAGLSVYMAVVPAGHYQWTQILLGTMDFQRSWVDMYNTKHRFEFDVQPGKVNYPGDFVIRTNLGDTLTQALKELDLPYAVMLLHVIYHGDLTDRLAMLMTTLTPEQRQALDRIGFAYIGPGEDSFPAYYQKIVASQRDKP